MASRLAVLFINPGRLLLPWIVFTGLFAGQIAAATLAELQSADKLRIKTWIEPADGIVARQQLKLQIEVATDKWFSGGARIGHFEIRDAIVLQRENFALNSTRTEGDNTWTVQQWTVVVYPQRSGVFEVPPIPLRLSIAGENFEPIEGKTQSRPLVFTAGQPAGMQGRDGWVATSRLEVSESFNKPLEELRPGDALQRIITISADNLPAMMLPQVQTADIPGMAIYTKPAELADKINRGDYIAERTQQITYVFESPGEYQLPAETFYWWNLASGSAETVTLAAQNLQVTGQPGQLTDQSEATGDDFSERLNSWLPTLYGVALVVIVSLAILWLIRTRMASGITREDSEQASQPTESQLLKQAKTACRQHDNEKAMGYLYQWMSYYGNNRDGAIGTRVDELGDDTLSQAYKDVMQAIYARDKPASTDTCRFIEQLIDTTRHRDKPRYPLQRSVEIKLN